MKDKKKKLTTSKNIPMDELEQLFENTFDKIIGSPKTSLIEPSLKVDFKETKKSPKVRSKTSLRMKYEAEVSSLIKQHGDLEEIRGELGLSQRKMCQLLMVDPSAWTRWTKKEGKAPPHIYRALQWYLILQEKNPEYKSSIWLNGVARPQLSAKELESIQNKLIESSKGELTKKAAFYLEEESIKRADLQNKLEAKIKANSQMKFLVYILMASQIILALGLLLI